MQCLFWTGKDRVKIGKAFINAIGVDIDSKFLLYKNYLIKSETLCHLKSNIATLIVVHIKAYIISSSL